MRKVFVLTSHPVQYQTSLFRALSSHKDVSFSIFFNLDFGVGKKDFDKEFNRHINWGEDVLRGFSYQYLKNYAPSPKPSFFGQMNFGVVRELFSGKYDAVWINAWSSFTHCLVFLVCALKGIPIILRTEAPLNQEFNKSPFKLFLRKIFFLYVLFPRISAFLYIGEQNKKFYQYYGVPDSKLFFTPYAVDNSYFSQRAQELVSQKDALRSLYAIPSDSIVILCVGKFIQKKRPLDVLRAFHLLHHKNISLVFVGEGILRADMEEYISHHKLSNVYIIGFKDQKELPEMYALADVFVLPSESGETWGLVVNEAMNFGLPAIVSDVVGCGLNLIEHNKNGFIFPLGNAKELAACLDSLIIDSEKRISFGERSRSLIQEYSYDTDIRGIIDSLTYIWRKKY